jgi:hypothetical protein
MNVITLVVGDYYGDGHGQTEKYLIESNLTEKELKAAYKVGTKTVGFDLTKKVCEDFEDHTISEKYRDKLAVYDIRVEEELDTEEFVTLYMSICKLGNENLVWNYGKREKYPSITIGGYGLFWL